jgi:hypothetical protein
MKEKIGNEKTENISFALSSREKEKYEKRNRNKERNMKHLE